MVERLNSDGKPLFLYGREIVFRRGAKLNSVALRIPRNVIKQLSIDIEDGTVEVMFLARNGQLVIIIESEMKA